MVKGARTRLLNAALVVAALLAACAGGGPAANLTDQEARGQRLFQANCASCHATSPDTVIVGPSLAGIVDRAGTRVAGQDASDYIKTSILDPGAYVNAGFDNLMPKTFGRMFNNEEMEALIAYLLTLK